MKAILSDIHGNLEALQAVLADIEARGIEEVICLGDVIGYGPNPRVCLELVRDADILLLGNHEDALLSGQAETFNRRARRSMDWTREQLWGEEIPEEEAGEARRIFTRFKLQATDPDDEAVFYVHGSPRNPTKEYVTPRDSRDARKMGAIFEMIGRLCFVGHTHVPGVFVRATDVSRISYDASRMTYSYSSPEGLFGVYICSGEKALVNVGSVGQPRDKDPRACYVTFDMDTVVYHRVEYDVEAVVARIRASSVLDDSLGERLRLGR